MSTQERNHPTLSAYIAKCGVASRRKAAEIIKNGQVKVNGETIDQPGVRVTPDDNVEINGQELEPENTVYIMLNKPRGFVCTNDDPYAKKTVFELIDMPGKRLFCVGRLDKDSEGLLILTNDGDIAQRLTHPSHEVKKIYRVKTDRELSGKDIQRLTAGIIDEDENLRALKIERLAENTYRFIMAEGRKREVRRLTAAAGANAVRLKREAVGELNLGGLKPGCWRKLDLTEVEKAFINM